MLGREAFRFADGRLEDYPAEVDNEIRKPSDHVIEDLVMSDTKA